MTRSRASAAQPANGDADTQSTASAEAKEAASAAEASPLVRLLARTGYAVLGLVHVLIGTISISAATGAGGGETDQTGAMSQIARTPGGFLLLWVMVLALFALTVWQAAQVVLARRTGIGEKWPRRVAEACKGLAYGVLGVTALIFAVGGRESSLKNTRTLSAHLLAAPGGMLVVIAAGLVVLGIGIGFTVIGVRRSFRKQLRVPRQPFRAIVAVVGCTGYVTKGLALGIVGVLLAVGALTHDAQTAGGLDEALKSLRDLPSGEVLLWIVGAGFIVYGGYCGIRAFLARM